MFDPPMQTDATTGGCYGVRFDDRVTRLVRSQRALYGAPKEEQ